MFVRKQKVGGNTYYQLVDRDETGKLVIIETLGNPEKIQKVYNFYNKNVSFVPADQLTNSDKS